MTAHSDPHILCVLQSLVQPAAFSFCGIVCSITYYFVNNALGANSALPFRLVLNKLCGPPVG